MMKFRLTNSVYNLSICAATVFVLLCAISAGPSQAEATSPSIRVVNNSSRVIRHVYLSPVDSDNWSADQLTEPTVMNPGESFAINTVTCPGSQIKVIGEDTDGCFLSTVLNCTGEAVWIITNDTVPSCGNN